MSQGGTRLEGDFLVRVSKEKAAENRRRILTAAARLFREQGIGGAGVDAITEAAGLTHGAFYSQFESKESVVAEAVRLAFDESRQAVERSSRGREKSQALTRLVDAYLARSHRDSPGNGCVVAALGADVARQPKKVRAAFTRALKDSLENLADLVPGKDAPRRYDDAITLFSGMLGALILARAVSDESLSRRILETVANRLPTTTRSGPLST
jgi:TetR/AcrR family transcriptional regulator, transcriptional repressor for nem operon